MSTDGQAAGGSARAAATVAAPVSSVQLTPPGRFDFNEANEWPKWIRRFERFRIASSLDKQSQEYQVNTLMYTLGDEAEDILNVLPLDDNQKKSYTDVKEAFEKHCVSKKNIIFERARFNRRNQEPGESAEAFITAVHTLAEHCNYGDLREELIRDRIESLQLDPDLTLQKTVARVRHSEEIKKQQPMLRGSLNDRQADNLDAISARRQTHKGTKGHKWSSQAKAENKSKDTGCGRCGHASKHPWKDCPAKEAECCKCKRKGHYARKCRSAGGINDITEESSEHGEEIAFLGEVTIIMDNVEHEWREDLKLNGETVEFKIDTGAGVTAIPSQQYSKKKHGPLQPPKIPLYGPGRQRLDVRGLFKGKLASRNKTSEQDVYVVAKLMRPLLGLPAIEALTLVKRVHTVQVGEDFTKTYPMVFKGLGKLKDPYKIELEPGATPHALSAPRRIPLPLQKKVRSELDRMEAMGVISKVTQPTPWCAGLVVVPRKLKDKLRLCVDLTPLNGWVKRERHILPAVDHTLAMLSGARVFTKLDATSGFWQIPLTEDSALLTTFITPFGRYCFNRLPFGISSAPEHFQRRMTQMMEGCEGAVCHADDILVFGQDQAEHDTRLHQVLKRLREEGLTLNKEKCEFSRGEVMFLGHQITTEGVKPDPSKVKAILEMPEPTNVADIRRVMGMANYLGKFLPHLSSFTRPLKDLLSEKTEWCWGALQREAFQKLKTELSSTRVLAVYSPCAETRVSADASSFGLGAVMVQKQPESGDWKPVMFISRGLSDAEKHYAQIEKEALAVTWACERLQPYLLGMRFTLKTDHKPLLPLLSTKALDALPPRVLRFRLRLLKFSYDIVHVPGKQFITADTLSRAPVEHTATQAEKDLEADVQIFVDAVIQSLPATETRLQQLAEKQKGDRLCRTLIHYCRTEWPDKVHLPAEMGPYWKERQNLTLAGDLLLKGQRIVIPSSMREEMLNVLHQGHQGIVKCRARARQSLWWPGLSADIKQKVGQCLTCTQHRRTEREPLLTTPVPERPWQRVGTDLFVWNKKTYLVAVDYFSRYIEVAHLNVATANTVIAALKHVFCTHGVPEFLMSDNGPQYACDLFRDFASEYGFNHITSSPRYPQANGEAERAVATVKGLWKEGGDLSKALLSYRSTPLENGYSPAQLLMGIQLRTTLPQVPKALSPRWPNIRQVRSMEMQAKRKQERLYNNRHRAHYKPDLRPGQGVWITTENAYGTVVQPTADPRSYIVRMENGLLRRTSTHLRATQQPPSDAQPLTPGVIGSGGVVNTAGDTGATPHRVTSSGRHSRPPKRLDL